MGDVCLLGTYLPMYLQPTGTSYLMKLMKLKWVDLTTQNCRIYLPPTSMMFGDVV